MPPRVVSGLVGDPDRLKALILSRPSVIEDGFRVLDVDLGAGAAGVIDIVGSDATGSLVLLAVAGRGGQDAALLRLLDQHLWASAQRDLLRRLYAAAGLAPDRALRYLLLAPAFTEAFLRCLTLLTVPVTALLVRPLPSRGEADVLIEPAAPIFGLEEVAGPATGSAAPAIDHATPAGRFAEADVRTTEVVPARVEAEEEIPVSVAAEVLDPAEPERDRVLEDFLKEGDVAGTFETLTADELEEFEQFERQRRQRDRHAT